MSEIQRILVVDDEPGILQNVTKILSRNDYEVFQASSASQALEEMAKRSFSLLISDIVMPEMNGLELLKMVKNQWPVTQVLMMTAYASTDTAVKAIRLGALDYLPKPFTPDELRSLVDRSLTGDLQEITVDDYEKRTIDAVHLDLPVDQAVEAQASEAFCALGEKVCEIFLVKGGTCKKGRRTGECPMAAKRAREAKRMFDGKKLIGVDAPFSYEEVTAVTGPQYVTNMGRDGFSYLPYEDLKYTASRVEMRLKRAKARKAEQAEAVAASRKAYEEVAAHSSKEYATNMDRDGFARVPYEKLKDSVMEVEAKLKQARMEALEPAIGADVLVIDDEVAVNNNIRKILNKSKYTVDQATTKEEAMERISTGYYRIIVLDLKIPGVEGLELLEATRTMQPEAKVIVITGYASIETAVESSKLGAMQYVPKPFTPDEMRNAVEKASRLAA